MSEKKKLWGLWAVALVMVMIATGVYYTKIANKTTQELVYALGNGIRESVDGAYEDKILSYRGIKYAFIGKQNKDLINEVVKSYADNVFYEIADTVYRTRLEFRGSNVKLSLEAKYAGIGLSKEFDIDGDGEYFWRRVSEEITENYKYKITGKVDLPDVIENKYGQCYSYSELVYVLGKEKGYAVRMAVNKEHAWNRIIIDGEEVVFDVTQEMGQLD